MRNWRVVRSRSQVSTLARQLVRSVKDDLTRLNQSQRNMLAALAMRNRDLSPAEAVKEFGGARSSIGYARSVTRFPETQLSAIVLAGLISVHVLDRLQREMGSAALAEHLLSLTDEEITARYVSSRGVVNKVPTLTPAQLRAQHAANVRWAKGKTATALPAMDVDSKWTATSINQALKVVTTARDLAEVGDIQGARKLMKVVGSSL